MTRHLTTPLSVAGALKKQLGNFERQKLMLVIQEADSSTRVRLFNTASGRVRHEHREPHVRNERYSIKIVCGAAQTRGGRVGNTSQIKVREALSLSPSLSPLDGLGRVCCVTNR